MNADGIMMSIILNYHLFELYDIIKEYESSLIKTKPILEDNNCETQESIQAQAHAYVQIRHGK